MNIKANIKEFSLEDFTRFTVQKLEELNHKIVFKNPKKTAEFPLGVIISPMEDINNTNEDNISISKRMSITIEYWDDSRYKAMKLQEEAMKKLRNYNYLPVGNNSLRSDEITDKNIISQTYEVIYNGINNSFEKIK